MRLNGGEKAYPVPAIQRKQQTSGPSISTSEPPIRHTSTLFSMDTLIQFSPKPLTSCPLMSVTSVAILDSCSFTHSTAFSQRAISAPLLQPLSLSLSTTPPPPPSPLRWREDLIPDVRNGDALLSLLVAVANLLCNGTFHLQ